MNRNTAFEEMLDNWAREKISYDDLRSFAEKQGIVHFEQEAELHKAVWEGLKNESLRRKIEHIHYEFATPTVPQKKPALIKSILQQKWISRVAASLLILTVLYVTQDTLLVSRDQLAREMSADYYMVNERNDAVAGAGSLIHNFVEGKYKNVISIYEETQGLPAREQFLAGYSYYLLKDFTNASAVFKSIIEQYREEPIPLYRDEAEYYLALCALHTGQYKEAYKLFKNIRSNKSHTYNEKVSGLNLFRLRLKGL